MSRKIAVIGLGYVGLPVALAFAKKNTHVIGFDIDKSRIEELRRGEDRTDEADLDTLRSTTMNITDDVAALNGCDFFVVTVPTPIDSDRRPDLRPMIGATRMLAEWLNPGAIVVYESTVYPGVTEEVCGPLLAEISGLKQGVDFKLGYSPERINPGDKVHTLERIVKVVSGEDAETLETVASVYESIIDAGVHRAPTIKVAEAAKVIENTQRDLNIALMNELSLIFDLMGVRTQDVLEAAGTKWNFLKFTPGLVGGHCIGVDPYYLTAKAQALGYHPDVILAGRRVNDSMGAYVAQRMVKLLIAAGFAVSGARVAVLGLTFKENCPDLRNSRVPDILAELAQFGVEVLVCDPLAEPAEAHHEYGVTLSKREDLKDIDGLIVAVSHSEYVEAGLDSLAGMLRPKAPIIDVKSIFAPESTPEGHAYWSL